MKQKTTALKRGFVLVLSIAMLLPAISGYAATPKQKAMKAYNKMMSRSTVSIKKKGAKLLDPDGKYGGYEDVAKYAPTKSSKTEFAIAYINNDNIPELIVRTNDKRYYGIFTYKNGKVVRMTGTQEDGTFNTVKGYYKKTGAFFDVRSANFGIDRDIYYKMSSTKAVPQMEVWTNSKGSKPSHEYSTFNRAGKVFPINHGAFNYKLKKLSKGKKATIVKYYKNTAKNRKKILK